MLNTIQNNQITTSWQLAQASVNSLAEAIQSGRSEALFTYLQTMAKFPTYSARNVLLIAAQRPTATHLEGMRSWNDLGRSVRPGEKGIRIFAPMLGVKPAIQNGSQAEENSKKAVRAKKTAATPPKETTQQSETQLLGFRGVYVFDVSQTGGEPLPDSRQPVDVAEKLEKLSAFAHAQGMTIEYADWIRPSKGSSYRGKIRLLPDMPPAEGLPVLLREVASQLLYTIRRRTFVTRALHQQEATAAAFVVCEALGLESKTDFSDCQLFYGDSRLLAESLAVVHRTAAAILGAISPEIAAPADAAQGVN
ncbi:MAG: ssDNA-binding domain-containing protein [Acidobacteriia bacterium]|nr:ssDNA-binding domain-containing protein [Terriglobia bacterium]